MLRKIYRPVINESTGDFERRKNTNLESLYNKPNIKCYVKAKRLEWAGHTWRAEGNIIRMVLITINQLASTPREDLGNDDKIESMQI